MKLAVTLDALNNGNFITFNLPQSSSGVSTGITTSINITTTSNLTLQANDESNIISNLDNTTGVYIVNSGTGSGSNGGFIINDSDGNPTTYLSFAGPDAADGSRSAVFKKINSLIF